MIFHPLQPLPPLTNVDKVHAPRVKSLGVMCAIQLGHKTLQRCKTGASSVFNFTLFLNFLF